ncbi:MAG TPA: heme ABC transporter ATP-binding protein [Anaerolineales bacterium]|nr:heme ABC transporter ATP-binding protein [Anaerolineales bacterium]
MLEIYALSAAYFETKVLREVSLRVESGEILALVGPNGAGKSTLIRAVSGVIPITGGIVRLNGVELNRLGYMQRARHLAVVPQARELPAAFTVYQTVLLGRTPYLSWLGTASQKDHAIVRLALERTHTAQLAERRVSDLSGGEQQRVLLARALAQDAPILLLDEPTTHLDLQHQSNLLNLVRQLCQENNLTVLMVLHDLNLAGLYADRVALMDSGHILATGSPEEVLTTENLSSVYQVPVNVIPHPDYGTPLVLPDGHAHSFA